MNITKRTIALSAVMFALCSFGQKMTPEKLLDKAKEYMYMAKKEHSREGAELALSYVDQALELKKKYVSAYVMKGRIGLWLAKDGADSLEAIKWFDKAIAINKKNPEGYLAYAEAYEGSNPEKAIAKVSEMLKYVRDYDVNLYAGRLYFDLADADKAAEYYSKANTSNMTEADFFYYYTCLRIKKEYDEIKALLPVSNEKFPKSAVLNRFSQVYYLFQKEYENALAASDILINKCDTAELTCEDYMNYGLAYAGLKQYNNAIEMYKKGIAHELKRENFRSDENFESAKSKEESHKAFAMQNMVAAYKDCGYPEEAVKIQKEYISKMKERGAVSANDYNNLALLYSELAECTTEDEEKRNAYREACEVYSEMISVLPEYAIYGYYKRIQFTWAGLDTDTTQGLAVADAEEIVQRVAMDTESKSDRAALVYALQYLTRHYWRVASETKEGEDYKKCGAYLKKLAELEPEDALYKALVEGELTRELYGL